MGRQNLYADVDSFRRVFVNSAVLDADDASEIERALETASRRVDEKTRRQFFAETATRVFAGDGERYLDIPDLLAATSIKLDEDGDRTFELTLTAGADYYLQNYGAPDEDAAPFTRLLLDGVNGQRSSFGTRERLVQIAGRWGYTEETEAVEASGVAVTGTLDNATDLTLATSAAADLGIGQTLLLEDEQVYISAGIASPFTVVRGVNGTTAVAHAAVAVRRFVYPPQARGAALIWAGREWKRRETAFANVIANPVVGSFEVYKLNDPDIEGLLNPLVRWSTMVA